MSYASDALIDTLERQVKKTKAENDKLRKTVTMLSSARTDLLAENATLYQQLADVTESTGRMEERCAKLRELVRILKNCADECGDCDTCPINGKSGVLNPWLGCDSLRDRMRELGVDG